MNIFKEMGLAVYNFKSYKEFLNNRKSKVFLFGVVLMLFYFLLTMVVPFFQMNGLGLSSAIQEVVPDFELKDGVLWVDDVIELDDGDTCIWIDTNPDEVFYEGPTKGRTREAVKGLHCGGRGRRLSRSGAVDHDGGQGDLERCTSQSLKRLR